MTVEGAQEEACGWAATSPSAASEALPSLSPCRGLRTTGPWR